MSQIVYSRSCFVSRFAIVVVFMHICAFSVQAAGNVYKEVAQDIVPEFNARANEIVEEAAREYLSEQRAPLGPKEVCVTYSCRACLTSTNKLSHSRTETLREHLYENQQSCRRGQNK